MNKIDVLILIVVGIPALLGLKSGLLKNLLALAGIVLGLFLAVRFYDAFAELFRHFSFLEKISNIAAFFSIVLVFYFAGILIANKITKINFITSAVDKIAGAVFGMLQGVVIASLILLFINSFNFIPYDIINDSKFYPHVVDAAPTVFDFISKLFPSVKTFFEEISILKK